METSSHQKAQSRPQPQKCSYVKNEKETSAITAFRAHFISHIQRLMMQVGIPRSEWGENHSTFLNFVHTALLCSFQNLHIMKIKLSHGISEEEFKCLNLLRVEGSLNEDLKLDAALNFFIAGFVRHLQKIILDAGFEY